MEEWKAVELLKATLEGTSWVVDGVLKEKDKIILLAKEKVGKSILLEQLCLCVSEKYPFLGFPVSRPTTVLYIGGESDSDEMQEHLKEMGRGGLMPRSQRFSIVMGVDHPFNSRQGLTDLMGLGERYSPDVLVVDPVYPCFGGSMKEDSDVGEWLGALNRFRDEFDSAVVVSQHSHRMRKDAKNLPIEEGDDAIFGSFLWKAWAKAVYLLSMNRDKTRTLSCATRRGRERGLDTEGMQLVMVQPSPLRFEKWRGLSATAETVGAYLESVESATQEELVEVTGRERTTVVKALQDLEGVGRVERQDGRPIIYRARQLRVDSASGGIVKDAREQGQPEKSEYP